jgi:microcompartment protein CcmL/EutN
MAVREEDLDDRKVISRVDNMTWNLFMDLLEVREKQSEFRRQNISQKRPRRPASQAMSASQASTATSLDGTFHTPIPYND